MERNRPLSQQYDQYSSTDFAVWKALFNRQISLLGQYGSSWYMRALEAVGFHAEAIPEFKSLNDRLLTMTGWQLHVVPDLVPAADFFQLLARRIFPATCWLRRMDELEYIEEPDMFHDVFGHVPLLSHPAYAGFMEQFGRLALQYIHQEEAIAQLSRVYWYTIEFGLIREQGQSRIYGAGIASSPGETLHSMHPLTPRQPFDTKHILHKDFRTDVIQDTYYEITHPEALMQILEQVQSFLSRQYALSVSV